MAGKTTTAVLKDLSIREMTILGSLIVVIFFLGLFPRSVINLARPSVENTLKIRKTCNFRHMNLCQIIIIRMTTIDFLCLTPLLILASAPVIIMLTLTVARNYRVIYGFSLFMYTAAFLSLFFTVSYLPHEIKPLLVFDNYSLLFLGIILFVSILITLLSYIYLGQHEGEKEEYFIVLFVATLGASILVISQHFISFFLGLETLSISLYILIAYLRRRDYSVEAGVKFLVIASVATAFLLFGMALIYAATGTMSFADIAPALFQMAGHHFYWQEPE